MTCLPHTFRPSALAARYSTSGAIPTVFLGRCTSKLKWRNARFFDTGISHDSPIHLGIRNSRKTSLLRWRRFYSDTPHGLRPQHRCVGTPCRAFENIYFRHAQVTSKMTSKRALFDVKMKLFFSDVLKISSAMVFGCQIREEGESQLFCQISTVSYSSNFLISSLGTRNHHPHETPNFQWYTAFRLIVCAGS